MNKQQQTLLRIGQLQKEIESREIELKKLKSDVLAAMTVQGDKSWSAQKDGFEVKATCVSPVSLVIDEPGLLEALPETVVPTVTNVVLDKKKLEDALARGVIEAGVVEQYSREEARTPYVKITAKGNPEDVAATPPAKRTNVVPGRRVVRK